MSDTLTLILDGTVTLEGFAKAIGHFHDLVGSLSNEVARGDPIEWVVTDLQIGSAVATITGRGAEASVTSVVRAFERVGRALQSRQDVPYSPRVRKEALALARLVNGQIEAVRFETQEVDALIHQTGDLKLLGLDVRVSEQQGDAFGAVEGIVEALSRRSGLRFTLYDLLYDKAVSCYLSPGYEDIMRDVWGKRAVVTGRVRRDPFTGRPLSVRNVTAIRELTEGQRGDWRKAEGAYKPPPGTPEQRIRALRDA
jgi:hypothetical protein